MECTSASNRGALPIENGFELWKELLKALDEDWLITVQKTGAIEVTPVFWCKACSFDISMPLRLETVKRQF